MRTFDLRAALLIGGATLLGAAWALFNLGRAGGSGGSDAVAALVWAVFGTPLCTFVGWLVAERRAGWTAAFVCFCIYFFAIFIGARLELLFVGRTGAAASDHVLYFRLTLLLQLVAGIVVAAQRALTRGTIKRPTEV